MSIFYNLKNNAFYDDNINIIPVNSIEISAEKYNELYNAINSGCVVFDDLTYSEPPPSSFHQWDGKKWVLDENKKNAAIIQKNESVKNLLLSTANEKIAILQDIIDLDMRESNEAEQLKHWKKYRILVIRVDTNQIEVNWPSPPDSIFSNRLN